MKTTNACVWLGILMLPGTALAQNMILPAQPAPTAAGWASQPNVDGTVQPFEYYDGKQLPMTGFTAGVGDVEGYIMVSRGPSPTWSTNCTIAASGAGTCRPQTLYLGFNVPITNPQSGHLDIFVDGRRDESFLPGNNVPKSDDRRIQINYSNVSPTSPSMGSVSLRQFRGAQGNWQDVTGTSAAVEMVAIVINQGDGTVHFELRLELTTEMVVVNQKLGFGVSHRSVTGGLFHSIPNLPGNGISMNQPLTWQTIELRDYDPIPVEVVSYNIGQMPTIIACPLIPGSLCAFYPIADGGEGYPKHFADEVFDKEIVCLQETWSRANREELLDEIDLRRSQANLTPMHVVGAPPSDNPDGDGAGLVSVGQVTLIMCLWIPYGPAIFVCEDQHVDQYTGLLLMSGREHLDSRVFEFGEQDSGQCYGDFEPFFSGDWDHDFDCAQDKGMLWARILTEASEITTTDAATGQQVKSEGNDASQFLDVFCTHADSGGDQEDRDAADADYDQLKAWIDSVRAPDRPAVLAGDMNANWQPGPTPNLATADGGVRHDSLTSRLGIDTLSTFDGLNSTFSDVYDIAAVDGVGNRIGTFPHSGAVTGGGCTQFTQAAMRHSPVYDYVLLLPAPGDETTFPNFAVQKDPTASVDVQFRANAVPLPDECLSDHAMVTARFNLAQTYEPGVWNPSRTHTVRHRVSSVHDFEEGYESDSLWEANTHRAAVGPSANNWSTDCNTVHPPSDQRVGECSLNWSSCDVTVSGTQFAGAFLDLDDEEGPGVYNFDTSSGGWSGMYQRSPHFVFDHFIGSWSQATNGWTLTGQATRLDDLNVPPNTKQWHYTLPLEGDGFFGNEETDYRARLTHILEVEE